jgi:hypothetical protein
MKSAVTKISDTTVITLTTCVDLLEIKLTTCSARLNADTLTRLADSVLDNQQYMQPIKELVIPFKNPT